MVEINQWLQDVDPRGSSHLEEDLFGGDCRSRSPLPNPSQRCKNRERVRSQLKRFNSGGQKCAQEPLGQWGRSPFYRPLKNKTIWAKNRATRHWARQDRAGCRPTWHQHPACRATRRKCDNFCIQTSIAMILGSLESRQRALQYYASKHHIPTIE
jgi:hypothetical protein